MKEFENTSNQMGLQMAFQAKMAEVRAQNGSSNPFSSLLFGVLFRRRCYRRPHHPRLVPLLFLLALLYLLALVPYLITK